MRFSSALFAACGALCIAPMLAFSPTARADLLVTARASQAVLRYDELTGEYLGDFISQADGGLVLPVGIRRGPDGHMYVSDQGLNQIRRYNGVTGQFIDVFASGPQLNEPTDFRFGSDGKLYVANFADGKIQQFDGQTGAFIKTFASVQDGVFSSLQFGPDNNLYVSDFLNNAVFKFNGTTGASMGQFASHFSLSGPGGLAFGPDNMLYVSSIFNSSLLRFDSTTGAYVDNLFTADAADFISGLLFDREGNLLVATLGGNTILKLSIDPPANLGIFASGGGLELPAQMLLRTPADANDDRLVDGADYVVWANHFQKSGNPAQGDFNGDGFIDGADYVVWANHFSSTASSVARAAMLVPEPATFAMALVGLLSLAALVRRPR